jgi:hypothetical protein
MLLLFTIDGSLRSNLTKMIVIGSAVLTEKARSLGRVVDGVVAAA